MMAVALLMATWWVSEAIPLAATSLLPLALFFSPLWTRIVPNGDRIEDSTIAMMASVLLFLLPAGNGERLLDWEWAAKLPWNVLLLFGGGFSLAAGFERSGFSDWVGAKLTLFESAPLPLFVLAVVTLLIVLTEFASNTASCAFILFTLFLVRPIFGI